MQDGPESQPSAPASPDRTRMAGQARAKCPLRAARAVDVQSDWTPTAHEVHGPVPEVQADRRCPQTAGACPVKVARATTVEQQDQHAP